MADVVGSGGDGYAGKLRLKKNSFASFFLCGDSHFVAGSVPAPGFNFFQSGNGGCRLIRL